MEVTKRDRSFARAGRVVAPLMLLVGAAPTRAQGAATPADVGRELYAAHCSRCHGADAGEMPAWQSQPDVAAGIRQHCAILGATAR